MAHAFLSPSGAPAWLRCPGKPWMEKGLPDSPNDAADEGSVAHWLRDYCLKTGGHASAQIGRPIYVYENGVTQDRLHGEHPRFEYTIDEDMARNVQKSIDELRELADGGELYSEIELDISWIACEDGATGTCDTVIVKGDTIIIDDLKYGHTPVHASSEQLIIYAAAAVSEFDLLGEVDKVICRISQPRAQDSDVFYTTAELDIEVAKIQEKAELILSGPENLPLIPGIIQCRYCRAKATCSANREFALQSVLGAFDKLEEPVDLKKGEIAISTIEVERIIANAYGVKPAAITHVGSAYVIKKPTLQPQLEAVVERIPTSEDEDLATVMDACDMIEGTVKAVRAEVERRLLAGSFTDPRYKLVEGKKGPRGWSSVEDVEAKMKSMRLKIDQMYDMKLKSAPAMEKVLVEKPRLWAKLKDFITQSNGKPSVAHVSDSRPALSVSVAEMFESLDEDLV